MRYTLGLDLGSNSLGWAVVKTHDDAIDKKLDRIVASGARVFDAGMEGDLEKGREESRNAKRRQARLQRRQTERRARKRGKLFRRLQRAGLLPAGDASSPENRHQRGPLRKRNITYVNGSVPKLVVFSSRRQVQ